MATAVPSYDWDLDEAFRTRIRMFSKILASMTDENCEPCAAGSQYMNDFYNDLSSSNPDDPEDWPHIDIAPIEQNMLHDSLGFAGLSAKRALKIVNSLENINALFPDETWRKKVDDEIVLRGRELDRIADDLDVAMVVHDPEHMLSDDRSAHHHYLDGIAQTRVRYVALVESRKGEREYAPANEGSLSRAFKVSGQQMALAMETLRYATGAMMVVEDAMQVLLGIAVLPAAHRSVLSMRTFELQDIAEHLMLVTQQALDDGQVLARDSYTAQEFGRPVFRSPAEISRQYLGSRPQ